MRAVAVARQPRRLDEAGLAAHVGLGPRHAGIERKVDDRGRDDDVGHRVAERGDDAHRQHEQRERHDGVGDAADDAVGPAAEEARGDAGEPAQREDQRHRGDGDAEIEPGGDDDPAEDVAAELVGAEPVRQLGGCRAEAGVAGERIVGHDRGAEDGASTISTKSANARPVTGFPRRRSGRAPARDGDGGRAVSLSAALRAAGVHTNSGSVRPARMRCR
jgi:hypothetical protein